MIDYVRGTLTEKEITTVAVEAHGVGYEVAVPLSTYGQLPAIGAEVKLFTHFHVREDVQKLYGFLTKAERELFRQLIGVSSIGPKTAIGILSKISVDELARCITLGDPSRLTKVPGIGAKTAERLIVELRGKLKVAKGGEVQAASEGPAGRKQQAGRSVDSGEEAFQALLSLGYNDKQVAKAVERVRQSIEGKELPVEEWIKKALQVI
jgi:holliday junction DNA helicase RuvA